MTDPLITRWLRAYYSQTQSGVAPWRAGRMTQHDYLAVTYRVTRYNQYVSLKFDLTKEFTADEIAALHQRGEDVRNAIAGNWSAVKM